MRGKSGFSKLRRIWAGEAPSLHKLGRLEASVMAVLWRRGESNVLEVKRQLTPGRAYTTVMTTLDRLYKRGLLERRKVERAFRYQPRYTAAEWQKRQTEALLDQFLRGPAAGGPELLLSCLVEALDRSGGELLEALERRIGERRRALGERER